MFRRHNDVVYMDLSLDLRDPDDWKVSPLRTLDYPQNVTSLAIEPISGLLAVGTAGGAIYVFGGPAVETMLTLPNTVSVRFVQFSQTTFQLICLDERNTLHLWDLASYGRPQILKSVRFDPTNALTLSPSLSHAFLALNSGEIRTYDLMCLRKSPYVLPNMWKLYEDKLFASGAPYTPTPESRTCIDVVLHPRDLNRIFIAYRGGVILANLTERNTDGAYELVIPPGAPGGNGYGHGDFLSHRRPGVTCLAVHPTGHFFVAGYEDGSLAFWALEDSDQPLFVRTLDELDVNLVDAERLDERIALKKTGNTSLTPDREPIFKLSWSSFSNSTDPRGGETTLAILGGLNPGEPAGLTVVQFPAFNPPEPASSPNTQRSSLHPDIRKAMRDSLDPLESYFYFALGTVQDYLLIPKDNPLFAGACDPIAVLLETEGAGDTRTIEAYEYPPLVFVSASAKGPVSSPEPGKDALDFLSSDLADTLESLQGNEEPRRVALPSALSHPNSGLLDGQLLTLDRETYETLNNNVEFGPVLPLKGGQAWSGVFEAASLKLVKYQPHRILITRHRDLTVRFHDASAQLLIGLPPTPLQKSFPNPLPDLTIDLRPVLTDAAVVKLTHSALVDHACPVSAHFATEALEATVVLNSGEVIHYRLSGPRRPALNSSTTHPELMKDPELILLSHVPSDRGFSPHLMLAPGLGSVAACAISDIGLVAVAYRGTLYIINTRGPEVLLKQEQANDKRTRSKHSIVSSHAEYSPITSMAFTVCRLDKDTEHCIRLIVMKESGHYQTFTFTQVGISWNFSEPIMAESGVQSPISGSVFVVDGKTGRRLYATRSCLAAAGVEGRNTPCILVVVGVKGARCFANVNGERVGKVEWGSKVGVIKCVQIVEKLGSHVLVVTTDRDDALLYSLPQLEYLMTLKLPSISSSSFTLDESGDFIAWTPHPSSGTIHQATYGTMFDIRRTYETPDIDFLCTKPVVPSPPQPVSLTPPSMFQLGSWLPFKQSMTGSQLDELLGGPDRPIPESQQQRWGLSPFESDKASDASRLATTATAAQAGIYDRMTSALSERGQVLNDLEERFNALEEGSKSMVAQAKRLATQQTAKSWFGL